MTKRRYDCLFHQILLSTVRYIRMEDFRQIKSSRANRVYRDSGCIGKHSARYIGNRSCQGIHAFFLKRTLPLVSFFINVLMLAGSPFRVSVGHKPSAFLVSVWEQ